MFLKSHANSKTDSINPTVKDYILIADYIYCYHLMIVWCLVTYKLLSYGILTTTQRERHKRDANYYLRLIHVQTGSEMLKDWSKVTQKKLIKSESKSNPVFHLPDHLKSHSEPFIVDSKNRTQPERSGNVIMENPT